MQLLKIIDLKFFCAIVLVVVSLFSTSTIGDTEVLKAHEEITISGVEQTYAGNVKRIQLFQ